MERPCVQQSGRLPAQGCRRTCLAEGLAESLSAPQLCRGCAGQAPTMATPWPWRSAGDPQGLQVAVAGLPESKHCLA